MALDRIANDTPRFILKLFSFVEDAGVFKLIALAAGIIINYLFDSPTKVQMATGAGLLIILDTLTGFMAAWKLRKRRTSEKLSRAITKSMGYLSVVAVAAVVEATILRGSGVPIVNGILTLVIATEGYSILENLEKMKIRRFKALRKILGRVMEADEDPDGQGPGFKLPEKTVEDKTNV